MNLRFVVWMTFQRTEPCAVAAFISEYEAKRYAQSMACKEAAYEVRELEMA